MDTRKHVHEEEFAAKAASVFAMLLKPSAIRNWWGAARAIVIPEAGGIWAASWGDSEDDPDYTTVATISTLDPSRRLVLGNYRYRARTGPLPFAADFVTEFLLLPWEGGVRVRVTQDGFPKTQESNAFYAACVSGWLATFAGMRRYLAARA